MRISGRNKARADLNAVPNLKLEKDKGYERKRICNSNRSGSRQRNADGDQNTKQYLDLCGKPVLYYSLHAFQESPVIDEILLVTGEQEIEYCRKEIVEKYQFTKVRKILAGGAERYLSVWNGIQAAENKGCLFIHDGARPFVDEEMIERVYEQVQKEKACVVGMPVKDTIKIADEKEYVQTTPDRSTVWMIQTLGRYFLTIS